MSKNKKKKEEQEVKEPINLAHFAYQPGTKLEIDSDLFMKMLSTLAMIGTQESKVTFPYEGENPDFQKPTRHITDMGAQSLFVLTLLEQVHMENIDSKVAVPVSEIKKAPAFSEVKKDEKVEVKGKPKLELSKKE